VIFIYRLHSRDRPACHLVLCKEDHPPHHQLRTAALELANGNPVGRVDVDRMSEIGELAQAFKSHE
jgi:HAMP domain-containing protein